MKFSELNHICPKCGERLTWEEKRYAIPPLPIIEGECMYYSICLKCGYKDENPCPMA